MARAMLAYSSFVRHEATCLWHNHRMCGRYRLSRKKQLLEEYFSTDPWEDEWNPRYNVAPTQPVPVIRQNPKEPHRELSLVRWGLIPSWAKDGSGAARMINARSETTATKPAAFRDALRFRRCLIPANGFYEWQRTGRAKQPYCFEVNEGELFAFAGIWERWKEHKKTPAFVIWIRRRFDGDSLKIPAWIFSWYECSRQPPDAVSR